VEILKMNNIEVKGLIFNGEQNKSSEDFILNYTKLECLGRVNFEKNIDKNVLKKYAEQFREDL
jgi:dethiobiotin synthetase